MNRLADWVARQEEGNRNAGAFWAANRAVEANQAADLSPLAVAARHAGLGEQEINRTLNSARRPPPAPHRSPGRKQIKTDEHQRPRQSRPAPT